MEDHYFGIPITKGKLLSQADNGFIVSLNFEHLLIDRLTGAQIFSKDKTPLSLMVLPSNLPSIFQFPLISNSPDLAITQKGSTVIVFIKSPKFTYSSDLRIVIWFQRHPKKLTHDDDFVDVPDQYVPLLIALAAKEMYLHTGKPVPEDIEQEIKQRTIELQSEGNVQNYYLENTFNLTQKDLDNLSEENNQRLEWKKSKKEFCHFANAEYLKNKDDYSNRKEAIRFFFDKYSFKDKRWTLDQCYNLLMQLLKR